MIINKKPLAISQVKTYISDLEEKPVINDYLKKFSKLTPAKADELIKEIIDLGNIKIKEEYAIKIADFLPTDSEELNKIVTDVSLSEEESNAILAIVKKY